MTLPYINSDKSKCDQVALMFDNIAPRYDFLNHFLSQGTDKCWRRKLSKKSNICNTDIVLDIATGTGDLAIELSKRKPEKIFGIDISEQMLIIASEKINKRNLQNIIELKYGNAEDIQFDDNYFNLVTISFGIRNFENIDKSLKEILRVLKPNGCLMILEFSKSRIFPVKQLFTLYFKYLLPMLGRMLSKDIRAYKYLTESVEAFPEGENFIEILAKAGFINISRKRLSGGIASLYISQKRKF
ncbi:MAG: bifunctional demethylmenaquinone methyltransferase/2-methoxy-6-polyprenyl-1,4-benzoquinol methylase UbiE [Bacteroidota bacterium]